MNQKDQETYRDILSVYEKRSTCARIKVACVIVKNGRNIVSGWNGALSGHVHCCDHFKDHTREQMLDEHRTFSLNNELHAEANCVAYAAKHGISVDGADAYVSYSPCLACAHSLAAAGIKRVFYKNVYDRTPEGVAYLQTHGIPVVQLEPSQNSGDSVCT